MCDRRAPMYPGVHHVLHMIERTQFFLLLIDLCLFCKMTPTDFLVKNDVAASGDSELSCKNFVKINKVMHSYEVTLFDKYTCTQGEGFFFLICLHCVFRFLGNFCLFVIDFSIKKSHFECDCVLR